jgi:hypothetical protein
MLVTLECVACVMVPNPTDIAQASKSDGMLAGCCSSWKPGSGTIAIVSVSFEIRMCNGGSCDWNHDIRD